MAGVIDISWKKDQVLREEVHAQILEYFRPYLDPSLRPGSEPPAKLKIQRLDNELTSHLRMRAHVVSMASQTPSEFQVTARRRHTPAGTYTYMIIGSDDPTWFEESTDPYPSREAALAAGHQRASQLERRT
jgi:hypothetical protein